MNIQVLKIHKRGSKVYGKKDVMNIFGKFIRNNPWWNPILVGIYRFKVNNKNKVWNMFKVNNKDTRMTPSQQSQIHEFLCKQNLILTRNSKFLVIQAVKTTQNIFLIRKSKSTQNLWNPPFAKISLHKNLSAYGKTMLMLLSHGFYEPAYKLSIWKT